MKGTRLNDGSLVPVRPEGRIFYGWWVVVGAFLIQGLSGALLFQSFGAYVVHLRREFGWSFKAIAGAFSLSRVESGMLGPLQGWMIDRFGARTILRFGLVIFAAGFFLFSRIDALWQFYGVYLLLSVGASLGGFLTVNTALANWFDRRRATAMGLSSTGWGVAGLLVPLVAVSLGTIGWRDTAIWSGVLVLGVGIPLSGLIRHAPEPYGYLPDGRGPREQTEDASENGEYLFVGIKWYGFVVIDVRDKLRPRLVSAINDSAGDYTGIVVDDEKAYIGMNWGALYIADVSDPARPALVGDTRRLVDGATGPHLHGKTLYFSGFENRPTLRIVDAANPADPKLLSEWRVPAKWFDSRRGGGSFAHRLGKYLVMPWACATLDVSDPAAPRLVGTLPDRDPYHQKVIARGHYAYLTNYHRKPDRGLSVVSLRDPKQPKIVGKLNADCSGGYYFGRGVYLRGDYLYGVSYGPFFIVDVSDPTRPTLVSITELRGFGSDCFINYPYAYVTMYYGGLNILDISNPANPVLIDWVGYGGYQDEAGWDNLGCYQSVATYRGAAYITEYYTGLMTFDVPTPDQAPAGKLTVRSHR